MTLTPFTDAARQSVARAREAFEKIDSQDPVQRIRERMSVDLNAAVLIGVGELLDHRCAAGEVAHAAIDVLASGLASVVLTMAGGNETLALSLAEHFNGRIAKRVEAHVHAAPERGITGTAGSQPVGGNA